MTETPRVVLLMIPFAGYDRGLLQGIARYTQLHGPWMFCLSGDHPGVPMPRTESINGETIEVRLTSGVTHRTPFHLQRFGCQRDHRPHQHARPGADPAGLGSAGDRHRSDRGAACRP